MGCSRTDPLPWWGTGFVWIAVVLAGMIGPSGANAQDSENLPEIPLTFRLPVAARYAGMGGASIAIADDHSASLANPATLGLVRGIEFAVGFGNQDGKRKVRRLGDWATADFGKTRLTHLGFAYPFPTYRGRFVIGFQYGRVSGLDSDFFKKGSSDAIVLDQEGIFETGGLGAYAISAALQVSPNVTLGATGTILGGSSFREARLRYEETTGNPYESYQTTDADISGVSGTLGALIELSRAIRVGVMIQLPENLDFDILVHEEYPDSSGQWVVEEDAVIDEINLPFRLGAGLALAQRNLIVAADAIYTDWTQIDFAGPVRTSDRENAYRETLELRVGAEYLLSFPAPVRLRAGYTLQPLAYRLLLTDVNEPRYEEARFDRDRQYFTFGVGFLLGETVTVDLAYLHGGFKRSAPEASPDRFVEEETDRRLLATLSLRLN